MFELGTFQIKAPKKGSTYDVDLEIRTGTPELMMMPRKSAALLEFVTLGMLEIFVTMTNVTYLIDLTMVGRRSIALNGKIRRVGSPQVLDFRVDCYLGPGLGH